MGSAGRVEQAYLVGLTSYTIGISGEGIVIYRRHVRFVDQQIHDLGSTSLGGGIETILYCPPAHRLFGESMEMKSFHTLELKLDEPDGLGMDEALIH
jgi:hypothetical protein